MADAGITAAANGRLGANATSRKTSAMISGKNTLRQNQDKEKTSGVRLREKSRPRAELKAGRRIEGDC